MTRPVAQRRARDLFDLCAGFVYSQVLLACVRLGLFNLLKEGPQTADSVGRRLSLSADSTTRLLNAAVSLRLVARRGSERFALGPLGAALCGNPAIANMVEHHGLLYADLADPVALLRAPRRDTELAQFWPYAGAEQPNGLAADQVAAYSVLMSASQALIAEDILDAYPLKQHQCLLDVGGGDGSFAAAAAARAPDLRVIVFDLPPVAERARETLAAKGLGDRATAVGGSFFSDSLPEGADIASLVRIIHDHDDEGALAILRNIRRALPEDGTLLLAEPMSGTAGAEPIGDAYFGLYLLAMGRGRPRTPDELDDLLSTAGFNEVRLLPTRRPLLTKLILARPGV